MSSSSSSNIASCCSWLLALRQARPRREKIERSELIAVMSCCHTVERKLAILRPVGGGWWCLVVAGGGGGIMQPLWMMC
jgi:hypothetical protein